MGPLLAFLYGIAAYAAAVATLLYLIGFSGNLLVPRAVDIGTGAPWAEAALVDVLLLVLFALQHSVMARRGFKERWTRVVPAAVERSTFIVATCLVLALLFRFWMPIPEPVLWNVGAPAGKALVWAVFGLGWVLVLVSTFLIDHFELFGLKQVWQGFRGTRPAAPRFVTPGPYRLVRHPLYLGFLIAFWAAPTMTVAHLVFAIMTTGYILIAIQLEERDLIVAHPEYAAYRRDVPMILPVAARRDDGADATATTR